MREVIGRENFVLVYVDTPLEVCASRDSKGFYEKARKGEIKGFTGIDDSYEVPENPTLRLSTVDTDPEANARTILEHLVESGFFLRS